MPSRLSPLPVLFLVLSLLAMVFGFWSLSSGPGPLPEVIQLRNPTSAVLDQRGRLYVVDSGGTRLTAAGRDGSFRWSHSASPQKGGFSVVHGLALDRDDRLYLVDLVRNRVQRLSSRGQLEQVYSPSPTGRLLAFDAFDAPWMVSDHRLYIEVLRLDTADGSIRLPPVTPPTLAAVGPHGEVSWADAEGRLWTLQDKDWQQLILPNVSRVAGLRYLDDGRLLVLDYPTQTWVTWKEGVLETILAPLNSQRTWSPHASMAADGTLVVVQPYANRVFLNNWGRTTFEEVRVDGWTRALYPWACFLVVSGFLGAGTALLLLFRAAARRALDLQIVQIVLLVPLVMAFVGWVHSNVEAQGRGQREHQRLEALEAAVGTLVPALTSHPQAFDALGTVGTNTGVLDYLRLLEPTAQGFRVVRAFPNAWIQGFETEVPGVSNLEVGKTLSVTYDGLWSRRQAAFARLGPHLLVEVGVESPPVVARSGPWSGFLWGLLSMVFTLGVGAYALAKVAPRYDWGRTLLAPFPSQPPGDSRESQGVVIALRWSPAPPGLHPKWVGQASTLVELCRRAGARVSSVNSQGALVVFPTTPFQGLELARSLVRLNPGCVVLVEGEWSYQTVRRVDRTDLVPVGDATKMAWSLAQGEVGERGGMLVAGSLVEGLELPWRGVDPQGPVVQILDPATPSHRAALDYLAPHNEAFRAWGEGRLEDARRGFSFVASRLPNDEVVLSLLRKVGP